MRAVAREGKAAAQAWQQAAQAIERAAKAGNAAAARARASAGGASAGGAAAAAAGIEANAARARSAAPPPQRQIPFYGYGDTLYGEIIPPSRSGGGGGGALPPPGPTIQGQAYRPGAASYGPYGAPFAGGGGTPPGGGGLPPGGGGGFGALPPPGGRGPIPLNPGPGWTRPGLNTLYNGYTPGPGADMSHGGLTAGIGAYGGYEWLKENWMLAAQLDEQQAGLMKQGFNAEETAKARSIALGLQQKLGTSVFTNMHIIEKMMTLTQSKDIALDEKAIEEFAKYQQVVNLHPGKSGIGDLDAAFRAAEFKGYLSETNPKTGEQELSPDRVAKFLKLLEAEHVVSGGDIGAKQNLQYLRSSGGAGAFINDDEMVRSMALQIALGSAKAGSALQGFEQQFTAGRMSEAAANLLIEMGLIGGGGTAAHNPRLRKMGIGQFLLLPGAMPEEMQKTATEQPSDFITKYLLPKYQDYARKQFGKAYDTADDKTKMRMEGQIAQSVASRIPGATEQVEAIRNFLLMMRDVDAVHAALQRDLYDIQVKNNPFIKSQAAENAYTGLRVGFGEATMAPITEGLGGISQFLNTISTWSKEHGEFTKVALEAFAGAIMALGAAGVIAILMTLGGTTGVLAGIGAGAVLAVKGLEALQDYLKKLVPSAFSTVDKTREEMQKGGVKLPWWAPIPAGPGGRDDAPDWAKRGWHELGMGSAQGAERPNAPVPQNSSSGSGHPMDVRIVNPQDLTSGMAGGLSNKLNRPPSGVTGSDPTIDVVGAMHGAMPVP
jgi:hypothetical protein